MIVCVSLCGSEAKIKKRGAFNSIRASQPSSITQRPNILIASSLVACGTARVTTSTTRHSVQTDYPS